MSLPSVPINELVGDRNRQSYLEKICQLIFALSGVARIAIVLGVIAVAILLDHSVPPEAFVADGVSYNAGQPTNVVNTPGGAVTSFHLTAAIRVRPTTSAVAIAANSITQPSFQLVISNGRLLAIPYALDQFPLAFPGHLNAGWHQVGVDGVSNGPLSITVDGRTKRWTAANLQQVQSSAQVGNRDFSYRFDVIGVGGAPFDGTILVHRLSVEYVGALPAIISGVFSIIAIVLTILLFWPFLVQVQRFQMRSSDIMVLIFTVAGLLAGLVADAMFPASRLVILPCLLLGTLVGVVVAGSYSVSVPSGIARFGGPVVAATGALCLLTLPNAGAIERIATHWPISTAAIVTACLCFSVLLLNTSLLFRPIGLKANWCALLALPLFALLALRSDALFSPINTLHWEYFAGPVRAIRCGGWLLWNVPSQYGLLNVWLTSLLPVREAINAVYLFQAACLFAAAGVFYWSLIGSLRMRWPYALVVVVAFFFLADPLMIGPEAYPSMSAVRFLWCYVIFAIALVCLPRRCDGVHRFVRFGGIAWLVAVFWSAESAVYATCIYFGAIAIASWIGSYGDAMSKIAMRAVKALAIPVGALAVVVVVIETTYLAVLHHAPDWSLYFMYVLGYGAGFGAIGVPPAGPVWVLAILCAGAGSAMVVHWRSGNLRALLTVLVAVLFAAIISTYYVGRAFPIVLSMISPLLVFAIFLIVRFSAVTKTQSLLGVLAVPLVALGVASAYWNVNAIRVAEEAPKITLSPASRYPQASHDLVALIRRAKITRNDAVVYYDSWVGMPSGGIGSFENTWLPTPIQALEKPVSLSERDRIIRRYVAAQRRGGYFIEALGPTDVAEAADSWLSLFRTFASVRLVAENRNYRIYDVVPPAGDVAWKR